LKAAFSWLKLHRLTAVDLLRQQHVLKTGCWNDIIPRDITMAYFVSLAQNFISRFLFPNLKFRSLFLFFLLPSLVLFLICS